jgi:hypothetical protein
VGKYGFSLVKILKIGDSPPRYAFQKELVGCENPPMYRSEMFYRSAMHNLDVLWTDQEEAP